MLIVQPLLIDPNVDNKTCLKLCEVWLAAFYPNLFLTFLCRSIVVPKRIGPGLADVCDSTCTERDRRKYRLGFFFTSTFDFSLCLLSYLFFGIFGVIVTAQILIEEEELIKNFEKDSASGRSAI